MNVLKLYENNTYFIKMTFYFKCNAFWNHLTFFHLSLRFKPPKSIYSTRKHIVCLGDYRKMHTDFNNMQ